MYNITFLNAEGELDSATVHAPDKDEFIRSLDPNGCILLDCTYIHLVDKFPA